MAQVDAPVPQYTLKVTEDLAGAVGTDDAARDGARDGATVGATVGARVGGSVVCRKFRRLLLLLVVAGMATWPWLLLAVIADFMTVCAWYVSSTWRWMFA